MCWLVIRYGLWHTKFHTDFMVKSELNEWLNYILFWLKSDFCESFFLTQFPIVVHKKVCGLSIH